MRSMNDKISPAFEPILADSKPTEKHDAIVIFRAPEDQGACPRRTLHSLKQRLDYVKAAAAAQQPIQSKTLATYQEASAKKLGRSEKTLTVANIGTTALPVAHVEVTRRTLPELAKQDNVVAVLPNQKIRLITPKKIDLSELSRAESKAGLTWGLEALEIPAIWEVSRGEGINVAVLDTGVHADHPVLEGRIDKFVVIDPLGRRIKAEPAFDGGQHGTHVCGTIAGQTTADGVAIGVAPEAKILAGGVLIGDATLRTLVEGISWAVEAGADIINMSLGFTYYEPLFAQLFDVLLDTYGVLPVCAIGNENHGNTSSPGNSRSALAVGAVEQVTRARLDVAFFSSGASLVFPAQSEGLVNKPDVVAPGVQVFSSVPLEQTQTGIRQYAYFDGTSMATPHVAGVAALLMAAKSSVPTSAIVQALKETAKHPEGSASRPDNRWGYGAVQPRAALQAL